MGVHELARVVSRCRAFVHTGENYWALIRLKTFRKLLICRYRVKSVSRRLHAAIRLRCANYGLVLVFFALASITATIAVSAQVPGGCDTPVSQRTGEAGCHLAATEALGLLPKGPLFWHLYMYPTRLAAEAAKDRAAPSSNHLEKSGWGRCI